MDDELKQARLHELGAVSRTVLDTRATKRSIDDARRRWLDGGASARPQWGAHRVVLAAASFACAVALVLGVALWAPRGRPVSFDVGSPPAAGAVGQWVAAEERSVDMRFSEGSSLLLAPGARVRVTDTSSQGATLLVERGRIAATVQHRSDATAWLLRAGPFQVRVTGTRFDAAWDPASETLEVTMYEGSVRVSGPLLPSDRPVVAGERLVVSGRAGTMELRTIGAPSASVTAQAPAPPPAVTAPAEPAEPAEPTTTTVAPKATAPRAELAWQALATAGKHREAIAAAERGGFSREVERASEGELFALSDAARFAGRADRAREALLGARRRFGARGRTAFLIGKIAADQQGSSGEAARWFETYLQEEPGGALAEEAIGRLLELRRGDRAAAGPLAARYLRAYPDGPHAALARRLVEP